MTKKTIGLIIGGIVIVTVSVCLTLLLLLGDQSLQAQIIAGVGIAFTVLGKPLVYWLRRDRDGDGKPYYADADDNDPSVS